MNDMSNMHGDKNATRGGAPVGFVTELDPVEASAVLYLRLWCDGAHAQEQVRNDFATLLGPKHGLHAIDSLQQLFSLCARHGRRPLMRHHVTCKCLGADESCFANFIAAASEGARDDAMWFATMIVRADMAPSLAGLAETLGLALKQMALKAAPTRYHPSTQLH